MTFATKHCAPLPSGDRSLDEAQIRTWHPEILRWKRGPARTDHPRQRFLAAKRATVTVG